MKLYTLIIYLLPGLPDIVLLAVRSPILNETRTALVQALLTLGAHEAFHVPLKIRRDTESVVIFDGLLTTVA